MRLGQLVIDVRPLKESRDYRWLFTGRVGLLLGSALTETAATWQVYEISGSTLAVGLNAVISSVAMVTGLMYGGKLADRVDRRKVLMMVRLPGILLAVLLAANSLLDEPSLAVVISASALIELTAGLGAPSSYAAVPSLVGSDRLAAVGALNGITTQLCYMLGPAIAGLLIAGPGIVICYVANAVGFVVFAGAVVFIRPMPPVGRSQDKRDGVPLREGLSFVARNRVLAGVLIIDSSAMLFAMPKGLFPALAMENIGGGATTFGLLAAAPGFGAIIGAATSGWTSRVSRPGMVVIGASMVWAAAVVGFGLTTSLPLALLFLALAGAGDLISEVLRSALLQHYTPDRLRGRVTSLWLAQANFAPALGNARAGAVAQFFSAATSVVSGGLLALGGAVLLGAVNPQLRKASLAPGTGADTAEAGPARDADVTTADATKTDTADADVTKAAATPEQHDA
ncbi:MFS transporter [Streptomyces zagrosensis]|uniref:ENTS family enterobactin (Siderophore) exporter n=1 Tax=Streptomyces zagrosensis TaxID=1042984 RepID=A0A7W9QHB2_9ACTN|nr:MFS transporter [Streptomyces zagrosensis]MBB5940280.1 ENTS family enterobactin (siderophore) exporter [Streptomyces zagrosensis]